MFKLADRKKQLDQREAELNKLADLLGLSNSERRQLKKNYLN